MEELQIWLQQLDLPVLLLVGVVTLAGFYSGKAVKFLRLPSIIGFMIIGVLLGPSLLGAVSDQLRDQLGFVTEIALGFVALSIGLELHLATLRKRGRTMISVILFESFMAFLLVGAAVYLLTGDAPLALIFGAIAPASAPAGTVAVIQEYRARGSLTSALYTVVGFDDGLGIIIFGFAMAVARHLLGAPGSNPGAWPLVAGPLKEVGLSFLIGGGAALLYGLLAGKIADSRDLFILAFAFVLVIIGLSRVLHLSLILTNMILGLTVANTMPPEMNERIRGQLTQVMPLLFVLFFVLAGANLHLSALASLGLVGLVYVAGRSAGLMGGAWMGAVVGRAEPKIRKYLGMGILSQAGVAIGLALVVKQELGPLGPQGARIGALVITSVTATSIIFEIIGPIMTRIGLTRAGEIQRP